MNSLKQFFHQNRMTFALGVLLSAIQTLGCAHSIHQVYVSDHRPYAAIESGDVIKASSEQFVILSMTTQTDYVDECYRKLIQQCPEGKISGITTQLSTSLGFFSWTNKALMQGLCIKSN